jgi:transcription initiation factor TFIID TATA-box-binding protein
VDECSLEVQNWVITCDIEVPLHPSAAKLTRFSLDLHNVAIKLRHLGMQYNPERFHAVIRRFRNPSAAVLVFEGGAVVCTGAKTQERAELLVSSTIRDIARLPQYRALRMRQGSWNVRNVVGSATMVFGIDLQRLYDANSQYSAYEPDIFPGATFRLSNPWARAILLFESGNLVITGAQSDEGLGKALELCIPFIWAARKGISREQYLSEMPTKTPEELVREQLYRDAIVTEPPDPFFLGEAEREGEGEEGDEEGFGYGSFLSNPFQLSF